MEIFIQNYLKSVKGREYFGILGVSRNIILKLSYINSMGGRGLNSAGSGYDKNAEFL
jgi:hypothetical protein